MSKGFSGMIENDVLRLGVSSGLSGVNAGVGVGEVLLDEPDKRMSGVAEVLFAWDGDSDPLTDERMETKRGRKGNAGRKGNVSNCAMGGSFQGLLLLHHAGKKFFLKEDWVEWHVHQFQSSGVYHDLGHDLRGH